MDTTRVAVAARSAKELKDVKKLFVVLPDPKAKAIPFLDEKVALAEMAKSPIGSTLVESVDGKTPKGGKVIYRKDAPKAKAKDGKEPKAKEPKAKAKAKPAKATEGKRPATFADNAKITVLVSENPKREGTAAHEMFKLYKKSATVASFLAAGGTRSCLAWDEAREFISIK